MDRALQRRGDAERSAALLRQVGRELRAAREQSGLTLAAVAEIIGWQKSALSKVEIGNPDGRHTNISLYHYLVLVEFLRGVMPQDHPAVALVRHFNRRRSTG